MTKKILGMFLALVLVFGGIASAAELSLNADLAPEQNITTLRSVVSGFYGEAELGPMVEVKDSGNSIERKIRGTNFGIKLNTEQPFYGLAQLNFGYTPMNKVSGKDKVVEEPFGTGKEDVDYNKFGYQGVEFGGGGELNAFGNVDIGTEVTLTNDTISDLDNYSLNVSVFASLDFAAFPSPKLEME